MMKLSADAIRSGDNSSVVRGDMSAAPIDPRARLARSGFPDPESVWRSFLECTHGDASGLLDLRFVSADGQNSSVLVESIDEAVTAISQNLGSNVYAGVARRRLARDLFDAEEARREPIFTRRQKAGGKRNLSEVNSFWIDWDPASEYTDSDDQAGHREEFLIALEQCPTGPPSMIVWSGSGFHVYWIFQDPVDVSTIESIAEFERVTKGLARHFKTDRATTDVSRVLRIPATINYPNVSKRSKGRSIEISHIYQRDNGVRF